MKRSTNKTGNGNGLDVLSFSSPTEFIAHHNLLRSGSYSFCLITEGVSQCVIADEELSMSSGQLHLFSGESINSFSSENLKCFIISGSGIFFPANNVRRGQTLHNFWTLSKTEFKMLKSCFRGALRKTHSKNTIVLLEIISALNAYYQEGLPNSDPGISSRRITLFHKFSNLVIEHFNQQHSVKFYADTLCITSGYLTKVVRAISSLSPKEFILRYIIHEAKVLLLMPDITVETVSEQLGFADTSAFSTLFKKHTGRSPRDFRAQNFKI